MRDVNRREFLTLAGLAPALLSLPVFPARRVCSRPAASPERFDPWLEIDLGSLAWNLAQIRSRVNGRPVMAVIKANAYGHGLLETARFLERQDVRHFAVGNVREAASLREHGIAATILNFGPFSPDEAAQLVRLEISQSVYSDAAEALARAARELGRRAKVHVKVDTGLGRVGVPFQQAASFIEKLASTPEISIEGIFTTFTEDPEFDRIQLQRFLQVCETARAKGIALGLRHAASSAAIATFPESFLDMVRPGDAIYGLEPLPNLDLRPAMSLKTRVTYLKKIGPGDSVSYHRRFTAQRETLVATLPLGYSDGYPAQAIGKAHALIGGRRWPLIAAVTANHITLDVTGAENIAIGDEVVLFGTQRGARLTLGELAEWAGSSVYRVAIRMSPLLPRILLDT